MNHISFPRASRSCLNLRAVSIPKPTLTFSRAASNGLTTSSSSLSSIELSRFTTRRLPFYVLFPRTFYNRRYTSQFTRRYSGMVQTKPKIELTEKEEQIRRILLDVAAEIDSETANNGSEEPLVLRITGGWVRDKLLQGLSHDIDIGINKMTGFTFASKLTEVLVRDKDKYGIDARSVHKIESNPDKSKHLETATTRLMDLDIDFVNLRSESYSAESRIPQMNFGTPREDALRRDATVNALFYNLHTMEVEDFTESGLSDMEKKLIRTPLAPFETFSDDPLRVLRLIRFASRLSFEIVEEVQEAMRNEEIKDALKKKISRERIGVEVEKMLLGANPFLSLFLFHSLGLFDAIFAPPPPPSESQTPQILPEEPREHLFIAANALRYLLHPEVKENYPLVGSLIRNKDEEHLAWVVAALTPWTGKTILEKKKPLPGAAVAARDGLKMKNKDVNIIRACFSNDKEIQASVRENETEPLARLKFGLAIRKWGADWRLQVLSSLLLDLVPQWNGVLEEQAYSDAQKPDYYESKLPDYQKTASEELVKSYGKLLNRMRELDLEEAWNLKPLVNGKELSDIVQRKSGTWTKDALDRVIEWQLEHPEQEKEQALEFVQSIKDELKGLK